MGETMPAVFFHGTLDVCQAEAVEEVVLLGGPTVPDKGRRHGVFHQNQKHVSNPGGFYSHQALRFWQLHTGFDGVVQGISEKRADIQRVQEVTGFKMDDRGKVNGLFPGQPGFVPNDCIQILIPGMLITLIRLELVLEGLSGLVKNRTVFGLGLQNQKMVFHVMVDLTDSLLILKAVLVVGFLFLQGLGPVGGLDRGTDIGGQIDAAKAGKDGGKTDGVDDSNVFRQKAKDGKDSHKWSQHQGIYNQPHGGRQTGGNLPQISPETEPGQRPKQQAKELESPDAPVKEKNKRLLVSSIK